MFDEIVSVSMPFVLSIVILVLRSGLRSYARRALKLTIPKEIRLADNIEELCVDLAVHTYSQLSFFFCLLLCSISFMGFTVASEHPGLAALGVLPPMILIPWWLIHWQALPAPEIEGHGGRWMRRWAWILTLGLWVATVIVQIGAPQP